MIAQRDYPRPPKRSTAKQIAKGWNSIEKIEVVNYPPLKRSKSRRLIYIIIALGVFIAILSAFNQKADTQSISTLKERCGYPYDAQGRLTSECSDLIFQAVQERGTKTGKYPSHTAPDQEGRVQW